MKEVRKMSDERLSAKRASFLAMAEKKGQSDAIPGKVIEKLVDVISEFEVLDSAYRKIHGQAVDIDDIDESKRIQDQTYQKIRKLKEWKQTINRLSEEIEQHLYIFSDHQGGQASQPVSLIDDEPEVEAPEIDEPFQMIDDEPEVEVPEIEESFPVIDDEPESVEPEAHESFELIDESADQPEDDIFVVDLEAVFDEFPEEQVIEKGRPRPQGHQPVSLILFGTSEPIDGWSQVLFKFCQSLLFRRP